MLSEFFNLSYKVHLAGAFLIRIILIWYSVYIDQVSEVPYTDVDYSVFTDASRHILNGETPYFRHTYRYSPLLAIILTPNLILHYTFGKVLFSLVDIIVGLLIRIIVKESISQFQQKYGRNSEPFLSIQKQPNIKKKDKKFKNKQRNLVKIKKNSDIWADYSMLIWLYNPMTLAISTRGNSDSIACALVLATLYFLQIKQHYFVAGLFHGLAVHFRLYPIIFSLSYFMYLSSFSYYSIDERTQESVSKQSKINHTSNKIDSRSLMPKAKEGRTIFKKKYLLYFVPNVDQIYLVAGCISSLVAFMSLFYYLYGYQFLYETYIYHFVRADTRHNFSLYFYLQYLTAWVKIGISQKALIILPQLILLLVFSVRYGLNKVALNFAILTQTIVKVIYNGVLTSQYFVWILGILPLCLWQIKLSKKAAMILTVLWFLAQGAWLLPAYLLEFKGHNSFVYIWIQGVSFFCVNIAILGRFIMHFMAIEGK